MRFLAYLIAALQTAEAGLGGVALSRLQSQQPPPAEATLSAVINDVAVLSTRIVLVLDDYHLIEAQAIHQAVAFILRHQPQQLHLAIVTREDPFLPVGRLRARGQITELRAADLRFTPSEATSFLNEVMGLALSSEDVAALAKRTEGWIAGLQLAALSMQGRTDVASFVRSFTGSHRFVFDYLVEEVLERQPDPIQTFLLQTSILDRLTGPLCDAVRFGVLISRHPRMMVRPRSRRWSAPICSSSPWITNAAGTGTTISSQTCCGGAFDRPIRIRFRPCISGRVHGTSSTICPRKRSAMRRLRAILSVSPTWQRWRGPMSREGTRPWRGLVGWPSCRRTLFGPGPCSQWPTPTLS